VSRGEGGGQDYWLLKADLSRSPLPPERPLSWPPVIRCAHRWPAALTSKPVHRVRRLCPSG